MMIKRILYACGLGTLLQRREWVRQHSARYRIHKLKKRLRAGDQKRGMFFNYDYSPDAWAAKEGVEYWYDYPDTNADIIRYFTRHGYRVEQSKFGRNLFIYRRTKK